jgi:hypothetical protein
VPPVLTRLAGGLAAITESVHFGTAEPTSSASVAPFRYAPPWGLSTPFHGHQVLTGYPGARFTVAQSSAPGGGIESKEGLHPPALSVASRALLEA